MLYEVITVPIATGIVPVGDAWACTNPSSGRGITFGLLHALHTVEALDAHRGDPLAQSLGWHGVTIRITSYNVCYTKLLRDRPCINCARRARWRLSERRNGKRFSGVAA